MLGKYLLNLPISSLKLVDGIYYQQIRSANYVVNQQGEKVVVSTRTQIRSKREKWQKVRPMGREPELLEILRIEKDERLHCDPEQARQTAMNKFQKLCERVQLSGCPRDIKTYNPPENVNEIINRICKEFNLNSTTFSDITQKFKFLTRCHQEFDHEVCNSDLHSINSIADVRNYYSTPVKANSTYNSLAYRSIENLPKNLHVIAEPIRFNPKTDTFFDGVNAFPGTPSQLVGLRAKKKYPSMEDNFIWPDV